MKTVWCTLSVSVRVCVVSVVMTEEGERKEGVGGGKICVAFLSVHEVMNFHAVPSPFLFLLLSSVLLGCLACIDISICVLPCSLFSGPSWTRTRGEGRLYTFLLSQLLRGLLQILLFRWPRYVGPVSSQTTQCFVTYQPPPPPPLPPPHTHSCAYL
jgi:hypothetical protein